MIKPKELEKLLDMPKRTIPRSTPNQIPNFSTHCHYTLRIYACTHKSFLPTPRITHVSPCLYAVPMTRSPIFADLSPRQLLSTSSRRCENLACKPMELHLDELCSKCRPHPLGTEKKLRKFETLTNTERHSTTTEDHTGNADEIEQGLKVLTLNPTSPASQPSTKLSLKLEPEKSLEVPAIEPTIEQPCDSDLKTPPDMQPKKDRWVNVCPSVANGEAAPGAKGTNRGLFSRISRPFRRTDDVSAPGTTAKNQTVEKAKADDENAVNEAKTEEKKGERWLKVKDDPDWEAVSDEERKEKISWMDEGEWVNVDR